MSIDKLMIKRQAWSANFTEKSHLYNRMLTKPEVFQTAMRRIFASKVYSENPLTRKLDAMNAVRTVDGDEWTWELRGC